VLTGELTASGLRPDVVVEARQDLQRLGISAKYLTVRSDRHDQGALGVVANLICSRQTSP
jgi:hypothetical protein